MKKKIIIPIVACLGALLLGLGILLIMNRVPDYQIVVNEVEGVLVTKEGLQVEDGEAVTIPQAEVYDKNGNYCEDFVVNRVIVDENGNKKASTLQMEHGQVYTVTYTADNGSEQLEETMKICCYDTTLPTVSLLNIQKSYNVNDEITIQIKDASKDIDYKESSIQLVNNTTKKKEKLSFSEAYKFVAEKESEQYSVVCNLKDNNGNENQQEFKFIIAGRFQDDDIDKNNIWDFDELEYLNNVKLAGSSDDLEYEIVTEKLPKGGKEVGAEAGALKLNLKAGEVYDLSLIDGNAFKIVDSSTIGFRVWTDEVIDIFEVYNVTDNSMYDLSWKVYKRNAWQTVEFASESIYTEDYVLDSMRIILSCERDVTVYIDSVYYTDYVEPWRDEDLPANVIAMFDDERYLERIIETSNTNEGTFGGSWEYVSKIPGTSDFTGGAIKFISTTDPTENGISLDGLKFQLFDRVRADEVGTLVVRIYCEDPITTFAVNFVDKKLGESQYLWRSVQGMQGKWVDVILSGEELDEVVYGYENIAYMNIRFIRSSDEETSSKEEYVTYIDKMMLYGRNVDYGRVKYTFDDDYDANVVNLINGGSTLKVRDSEAKDGYALKVMPAFSAELSGGEITFDNLDLSRYSSIYMTVKATDNVEFWLNGEYGGYISCKEYTEVDLLPYLLAAGETNLQSLIVGRKHSYLQSIDIDDIVFITVENAPVYNDIKLTAGDFEKNVGSIKYSTFEGGSLANIVPGSISKGLYHGKTDVIAFSPKAVDGEKYSGGGLYIDFSSKLPRGKIQCNVDFSIDAVVYSDRHVALRVGIIHGAGSASTISWKNVWVETSTEMSGWQVIHVTSEQLREVQDCSDKEITGIYIGSQTPDCNIGLKEVYVDFKPDNTYPDYNVDDSYMKKRDDNSIYLSDFNSPTVLNNADEVGVNPWNKLVEEKGTISHGNLKNGLGTYTGITIDMEENNSYSGVRYHLPDTFELKQANELVFRVASETWTNGYVPTFLYLTNGNIRINIIEYCKIYVGQEIAGTPITKVECLDGVNYNTVCIVADVSAIMKAGITSIDGFIFGHSRSEMPQVLDEFYYTLEATKVEEIKPEYGELVTTYFNSENVDSGNYILTDTDNGLQITGSAWTYANYTFAKPLNGAEINTITVRFKETSDSAAIMYFYSGEERFYVELANVPSEQIVSKSVDADGFTVLTLNFQTFGMDTGDTWTADERATKALTGINLCCNKASGAPIFDYVAYNVELGEENIGEVSEYLDFTVDVEAGREIRILQLTDTQIIDPGQKRYPSRIGSSSSITSAMMYETCFSYIEDAINKTNPDLILLTGDIVYGEFDDDGHIFQAIVEYMDSFGIPWAPVYGNHDNESQMGVTWQNQQLINAENCLFKKGDVTGNGNYTIGITQGGELVKVIYMMDSNGCAGAYSYTYEEGGVPNTLNYNENESVKTTIGFAADQREWLSNTASAITTLTEGEVSSMIAFHIPIAQFAYGVHEAGYQSDASLSNSELYEIGKDVTAKEGDSGYKGAAFKDIYQDAELWRILKENNFDGVFCGHSHENSVSVKYDGIRLTFGLKTGTHDRYIDGRTGGTLITMQEDGSFAVTHQYYKLDLSEVDYSFSGADDKDMRAVGVYNNANVVMVADSTATDGYALEVQRFGLSGGVKIIFDSIDISEYNKIVLRMKKGQNNLFIYANDMQYLGASTSTTYEEIDLLSLLTENGISTLDKIVIKNDGADTLSFYVDSIILQKKDGGNNESEVHDVTYFTAANTTGDYYVKTDTENGLQITGARWVYEMHTLATPINGADIETITVRFKVTGGEAAIMKFFSGDEFFYVHLNGVPDTYVVNQYVDAQGFTVLTLDFQAFVMDAGDTWTPDEREAKNLTAIGLCCNNETGAPTFDYVAYNAVETIDFLTTNVTANGYDMTDTENGLQITNAAWSYAMYQLSNAIDGNDINTVTIRFKAPSNIWHTAIMKFYSGEKFFYVDLNAVTGDYVLNKDVDEDGFTILTMDFSKISMDAGDTWLPDERATNDLTAMGLCCNNATGAPIFDYVIFTLK